MTQGAVDVLGAVEVLIIDENHAISKGIGADHVECTKREGGFSNVPERQQPLSILVGLKTMKFEECG